MSGDGNHVQLLPEALSAWLPPRSSLDWKDGIWQGATEVGFEALDREMIEP